MEDRDLKLRTRQFALRSMKLADSIRDPAERLQPSLSVVELPWEQIIVLHVEPDPRLSLLPSWERWKRKQTNQPSGWN